MALWQSVILCCSMQVKEALRLMIMVQPVSPSWLSTKAEILYVRVLMEITYAYVLSGAKFCRKGSVYCGLDFSPF